MRWIWLLVLCACGDNVVPRLVPATYAFDDVTYTQPGVFHDTLRDEDCRPVRWADGATYCTPRYLDAVYTDDACSDAISGQPSGYTATYFTIAGHTDVRRLHRVTPSTRTPAQYWLLTQSGCQGPYPAPPNAAWGDIGDELDETSFVRLLRSAPEGEGRLQTIAWNTSDGLHEPMGFHDRELGVDCTVDSTFGADRDHVVCRPPADPVFYYADAACSEPVEVAAVTPALIQLGCETFAQVGAERSGTLYTLESGICTQTVAPSGTRQYAIGAPVEPPTLSREVSGAGRIQAIALVGDGVRVPDLFLHDRMLDVDCVPEPQPDGARCLPSYQNVATYYGDDQCSQTIQIMEANIGTCYAPVKWAQGPDGFHEVGAIVTTPLYVPSTGDTCMLQPPAEPHAVGPAQPITIFAPAL